MKIILYVLSSTRFCYEGLKKRSGPPCSDARTRFAKGWPKWFICIEAIALLALGEAIGQGLLPREWYLASLPGWFAISRIVEVVYAYANDSVDTLRGKPKDTRLDAVDRIGLAMLSYGSLIITWALLYYIWLPGEFNSKLSGPLDAVYLSGTTITTLGSNIVPSCAISKLGLVVEVLTGMIVVVLAVGSYLGSISGGHDNATR